MYFRRLGALLASARQKCAMGQMGMASKRPNIIVPTRQKDIIVPTRQKPTEGSGWEIFSHVVLFAAVMEIGCRFCCNVREFNRRGSKQYFEELSDQLSGQARREQLLMLREIRRLLEAKAETCRQLCEARVKGDGPEQDAARAHEEDHDYVRSP